MLTDRWWKHPTDIMCDIMQHTQFLENSKFVNIIFQIVMYVYEF